MQVLLGTKPGPATRLCDPCGCKGLRAQKGPVLVQCSVIAILKFLIVYGQRACFIFAFDHVRYVAGPT